MKTTLLTLITLLALTGFVCADETPDYLGYSQPIKVDRDLRSPSVNPFLVPGSKPAARWTRIKAPPVPGQVRTKRPVKRFFERVKARRKGRVRFNFAPVLRIGL